MGRLPNFADNPQQKLRAHDIALNRRATNPMACLPHQPGVALEQVLQPPREVEGQTHAGTRSAVRAHVEHVGGQVHTQGMEFLWLMLKRARRGSFHKLNRKHLDRYVHELARRHNSLGLDTIARMTSVVAGMIGRGLMYEDPIADNGLSSGARS